MSGIVCGTCGSKLLIIGTEMWPPIIQCAAGHPITGLVIMLQGEAELMRELVDAVLDNDCNHYLCSPGNCQTCDRQFEAVDRYNKWGGA